MEIEVKSIIGELDHPNHNGRIYPLEVMKEAIEEWKNKDKKFGELNPDYNNNSVVLGNISHKVEDIWINENKEICGRVKLYDTPQGKIVENLIKNKQNVELAPCMIGTQETTIDENGNPLTVITKIDSILTFDLV